MFCSSKCEVMHTKKNYLMYICIVINDINILNQKRDTTELRLVSWKQSSEYPCVDKKKEKISILYRFKAQLGIIYKEKAKYWCEPLIDYFLTTSYNRGRLVRPVSFVAPIAQKGGLPYGCDLYAGY